MADIARRKLKHSLVEYNRSADGKHAKKLQLTITVLAVESIVLLVCEDGMRDRYWRFLNQCKSDLLYYDCYYQHTIRVGRRFKVLSAAISVISVALWALYEKGSIIYGVLIMIAQVCSAVYEYLPYQRRADELFEMKSRLQKIYTKVEHEWFFVDNQHYDASRINETRTNLIDEWTSVESMFFQKDALPRNKAMLLRADEEKNRYFENTL